MSTLFGSGTHAVAKSATRAMGIDLQGAQYGAPIPVVFGQNKVAGNVIWYGDFKATGHQQKQPGKGGGGQSSTTYTYSSSFELGLCEGPASVVTVYQGSSTVNLSASGGIGFSGTVGQAAWSHLSGAASLGYSGTSLAAFQNLQLGSSASLPNFNFEMAGRNQFGGGVLDANPADILTAICTDTQIGVQFNYLGDLTNFSAYCSAAGLLFSPVYATQQSASQSLTDLFKYSNSACWFSEGVLKVQPYGDATITGNGVTYTPNNASVADLGPNDFITNGPGDPVTIKRVGPADAMNLVRVEYKDRANTYHTGGVVASIDQDVVGTGARADQSESVDMITNGATARLVAQNLLQRIYYIRNTYEFQLSWRYCYLEPMDIVTLTDANTGLYLSPVRITEVSEDEHGLLSIVAEEFPQGVSHGGTYGTQPNAGTTVDPNHDPGPVDGPYLFRGPGFLVSNATPEIWCAVTGNDPLWAGCDVYLSHDGTSYTYLNTTSRKASYGYLTNTLAANADPDTTGAPNVVLNGGAQILGGTQADADQFVTLAMLDQEIIAYQTATLAGGPSYTLGYLRRGGYGSAIASHAVNAPFVRLDENILRIPVDPSQIGQTVYLKFVSFNAFGRGGRTLASETAYTYVIGTNIELPDVPITPSSFAATGVADGVSLTWINANPAAVGVTSIEYATASGGPWTVLAQVGPTNTSYAHHFTTGATYFYRARSRGPLVSAGFSAYTATVSNTGTNVGAISTTANTASTNANIGLSLAKQQGILDPNFAQGLNYWTPDGLNEGWYSENGASSPNPLVGTYAVHAGSTINPLNTTATQNTALRSTAFIPVTQGQLVSCSAQIKNTGTADGRALCRISWRNASQAEISVSEGNSITTGTGTSRLTPTPAPTGAVYAHVEVVAYSHTVGYYTFTAVGWAYSPSNQSEVPNGGGHNSVTAIDGNGLALIDFTQSGHVSKNLDNIGDGPNFGRVYGTDLTGNRLDFAKGLLNKQLDNIPDGATYGRPLLSRLSSGNPLIDFAAGYHLNKTIDNLADGNTYIRAMQPAGSGSQWDIDNSTFQIGTIGSAAPGWNGFGPVNTYLQGGSSPAPSYGAQYLVVGTGTAGAGVLSRKTFYPKPGDKISIAALVYANSAQFTVAQVNFYTAANAYIGSIAAGSYVAAWTGASGSGVVPSNAAYATVTLQVNAANSYGSFNFVQVTVNDVRVAGSGAVLGNQLNAPNSLTLNYGAARTATACTASSTGAVSINAFSVNMGGTNVSYNAVSNAVTGLTVGSTYQIYCHDVGGTGGTKTWLAYLGTSTGLLTLGDDVVLAGQVTIPSSGTSGGGGTGTCVCDDMFIDESRTAGDARPGDVFDCLDLPATGLRKLRRRLLAVERSMQPCVRLATDAGAVLACSVSTPFDLLDGRSVLAPAMLGERVVTDLGIETVVRVEDIGPRPISHIHLGGISFAAGADPAHRIYSHNALKQ